MDQGESPESAGGSGQNDLQYDRQGVPARTAAEDHHGLLTTRSYFSQQLRIYSLRQLRQLRQHYTILRGIVLPFHQHQQYHWSLYQGNSVLWWRT